MPDLLIRLLFPAMVLGFCVVFWNAVGDMSLQARGFPQLGLILLAFFTIFALAIDLKEWFAARAAADESDVETPRHAAPQTGGEAQQAGVTDDEQTALQETTGQLQQQDDEPQRTGLAGLLVRPWSKTFAMLVIGFLTVAGVQWVGWYTSFAFLLVSGYLFLRVKIWPTLPIIVAGIMLLVYLLFEVLLGLRLPVTPLP